jgi:hypothetical protein
LEIKLSGRTFTWSNNQEQAVMSHIDWVFCSTDFDSHYSLASARTIPRTPSDHTPILWDSGTDIGIRKPRFKLEKWWIKHKEFRRLVHQIWTSPHVGMSAIDRWQTRIRALRRKAKGWRVTEPPQK